MANESNESNVLPEDFPEVSEDELLATVQRVFDTGADLIPPEEVFADYPGA